jgi:ketosteroid isomerase-like protein
VVSSDYGVAAQCGASRAEGKSQKGKPRTMLRAILLFLALTAIPAAASHAAKPSDIAPKIEAANKAWLAAYAKGDATALAALYTDTATILPAGAALVGGHDAIVKFMKATIDSGLKITALTTVSIDRHGSVALEVGRLAGDAPGPDNKMVHLEGKYVVYWKRVNGAWKLDTDIWNMNK